MSEIKRVQVVCKYMSSAGQVIIMVPKDFNQHIELLLMTEQKV